MTHGLDKDKQISVITARVKISTECVLLDPLFPELISPLGKATRRK